MQSMINIETNQILHKSRDLGMERVVLHWEDVIDKRCTCDTAYGSFQIVLSMMTPSFPVSPTTVTITKTTKQTWG